MDFDLEIISEEGDCQDPLFDSILKAMNSMKEATADKIYQKIQKEGKTDYSKPQVDRALESALKYGIFEVKNNRYRVRDDMLDDEETVYWKLQNKKEQTPFQILDDATEGQCGQKLNPETDNKRFRKMYSSEKFECPECGRPKKEYGSLKSKPRRKPGRRRVNKKKRKPTKKRHSHHKPHVIDPPNESNNSNLNATIFPPKKKDYKRKMKTSCGERCSKMRRLCDQNTFKASLGGHQCLKDLVSDDEKKTKNNTTDSKKNDSTDSEAEILDDEQSYAVYEEKNETKKKNNKPKKPAEFVPEFDDIERPSGNLVPKESTDSVKTESESEKSSVGSEEPSCSNKGFFENTTAATKSYTQERNRLSGVGQIYDKQYERGQNDHCERKSDWMGYTDEPQGTIIQSNNVLTIQPMDSLAFKSPEHTSYIT